MKQCWFGCLLVLATVAVSCEEAEFDSGSLGVVERTGAGDAPSVGMERGWQIRISENAPSPVRQAAQDVASYFRTMGESAEVVSYEGLSSCSAHRHRVDFVGDGLNSAAISPPGDGNSQSYAFVEERCSNGTVIRLAGGGLLGRQYAAYEMLHALGVRFFHPEQEYVPQRLSLPKDPLSVAHTPDFKWRSVTLHLTHPLELGDAFRLGERAYFGEARRYIDWQVKNLASYGTAGVGDGEFAQYGIERGFPRAQGFSLHNQQQGGSRIIDPDSPLTEEQQIAQAIDSRMQSESGDYPEFFQLTFNPSEFTELPDTDIVRQLTFIANYMEESYPGTQIIATNHGTAGPPTENYGVRFYDLPKFAPTNMGVKVHTLMFYDLFRPAPVYGNENFNYLFDFMEEVYQERQVWHYPEAAWWLTFDIAIPLYLPITIEARDRDIQGIKHMLSGGLDGHRTFGSGHEWGYWQNEYCAYRLAADVDYRWTDCLDDITSPVMGDAGPAVAAVLQDVIASQERDLIYDVDTLRFLVGTDPETELAASIGIEFHPLPPTIDSIASWTSEDVEAFLDGPYERLKRMDDEYQEYVERLEDVRDTVPENGMPWFAEILDGVEATGLRARHAWQIYGAAATWRAAQLSGDDAVRSDARDLLDAALKTTDEVRSVVRRRELQYRYSRERSIAPRREGDVDDNWTVYPYRYLHRTHHVYFYRYIDRQVEELFDGTGRQWETNALALKLGDPFEVIVTDDALENVSVDLGDGTVVESREVSHTYAEAGSYTVSIEASVEGEPREFSIPVVVAARIWEEEERSARLLKPEISDPSLLEGVLPQVVFGDVDASTLFFGTLNRGRLDPDAWGLLNRAGEGYESTPEDLQLGVAGGAAVFEVADGVVRLDGEDLSLTGALGTDSIVDGIVGLTDAFEPEDARALVASTLGYTVETLPESVDFEVRWTVLER